MAGTTIAAISTGLTNSGIGKVRMSGDESLTIIDKIFRRKNGKQGLGETESHTIHYGYIYDGDQLIDEVLVLVMKGPRSYTTEDIIEIDCHGGVVVMKKILELLIKNGAAPAMPGEFTKRAFLNGRIDLTQAEAVIDVIQSKNELALKSSARALKGQILVKIREIRSDILGSIAFIEAAMDDPEHIETGNFSQELLGNVDKQMKIIGQMLISADNGRLIREGIQTVIVGKPNAGKSSLLNVLVGDERAIVTDVAGTTRDTLEEFIHINGIPLNIIDTAGIRSTEDVVEKIGVDKAKTFAQDADLIIYVVDSAVPLDENDEEIMRMIGDKQAIVLLNKIDLEQVISREQMAEKKGHPVVEISAKKAEGIDKLENLLKEMFFKGGLDYNDELLITNVRHKTLLQEAQDSLKMVRESILQEMPEDFFSIDLMNAYQALGMVIGEAVEDDLVDKIFSEFCMGK